jgi:hypothetical protein
MASLVLFQGPKKSRFSGPTPSNAPRNDVAPLKIITYRAIKTTGTLIVNISARKLNCNKNIFCVGQHKDFMIFCRLFQRQYQTQMVHATVEGRTTV